MTNEELSERVAELYGIDAYYITGYNAFSQEEETWLHDDSARVFELMVEHGVEVEFGNSNVFATDMSREYPHSSEPYTTHKNDKALATRIAILKCLVKMKE